MNVWTQHEGDPYPSRIGASPRLIPRAEPVVYGMRSGKSPLTHEQIASYEKNGFLDLAFDWGGEFCRMASELSRLRHDRSSLPPETAIEEPDSGALRSVFRVHIASEIFAGILTSGPLLDIARFLLDDDIYIHQSRLNYKPGFRGREFYWHSDFETWHVEDGMPRMRALSMSIALTPNTAHNGPLMLVRGSHKYFIACAGQTPDENYKRSLKKQDIGVPDDEMLARLVAEGGIEASVGPAGIVTIFDCNTIHGSNGNITPAPRSNVFVVYNSIGNRLRAPFGGKPPRPEFLAERSAVPIRLRGA